MYRETNTDPNFPYSNTTHASIDGEGEPDSVSTALEGGAVGIMGSAPVVAGLAFVGVATLFTML